jgi:NADPH:quinone reductase-like Zn-dependent oxidoreductase
MKFIDHGAGGPPDVMRVIEGAAPQLQAGQVLIEVHFAGVNRPDVAQRLGRYPPPADASPVLGLEVAGRIVATASDVTTWKIGDEVCALTHGGGYAEYCAAHASHCLPVPQGCSLLQAAALPENFFTV